jgi:hypothetical protein
MTREELRIKYDETMSRVSFDCKGNLVDLEYIKWVEDTYLDLVESINSGIRAYIKLYNDPILMENLDHKDIK